MDSVGKSYEILNHLNILINLIDGFDNSNTEDDVEGARFSTFLQNFANNIQPVIGSLNSNQLNNAEIEEVQTINTLLIKFLNSIELKDYVFAHDIILYEIKPLLRCWRGDERFEGL